MHLKYRCPNVLSSGRRLSSRRRRGNLSVFEENGLRFKVYIGFRVSGVVTSWVLARACTPMLFAPVLADLKAEVDTMALLRNPRV